MSLLKALALSFAIAQPAVAQELWIVDFYSGPGADFTEIQPAIDAASDGDTILIREGFAYDGFQIDDRSLALLADAPGRVLFETEQRIEVRNLSVGKWVTLEGFGPDGIDDPLPGAKLEAVNCEGTLWLEDCSFGTKLPAINTPPLSSAGAAANFIDCLSVVMIDCRVGGSPSMQAVRSGVHMFDSELEGRTFSGAAALELDSAFCFVSNSTLTGGVGGYDVASVPCVEDGGPGARLSSSSELFEQGSAFVGGPIEFSWISICQAFGNPTIGSTGPPILADPGSLVMTLQGPPRSYVVPGLSSAGDPIDRVFEGQVGDSVFFFTDPVPDPVFFDYLNGSTLTGSSTPAVLGAVGPTGSLILPSTAALSPGLLAETTFEQGIHLDAGGVSFVGSASAVTVVDPSVVRRTGPDCNGNGFPDAEDLALGVSLDCNQNGTPDECEAFTPVSLQELVPDLFSQGFGHALAMSGETIAVGAPMFALNGIGAVHIFENQAGTWVETQVLTATDSVDQVAGFGASLALEGDELIVGSPGNLNPSLENEGAVYVFERSAGVWTQTQRLKGSAGTAVMRFGEIVARDGDSLAVSAPDAPSKVFLFERIGGQWGQDQVIKPDASNANFGSALDLEGDLLAIGNPFDAVEGVVRIYRRVGGSWNEEETLRGSKDADHFGAAVEVVGGELFIGAEDEDILNVSDGKIFVFQQDGLGRWKQLSKLVSLDPLVRGLGTALSTDGSRVIGLSAASPLPRQLVFERDSGGSWLPFPRAVLSLGTPTSVLLEGSTVLTGYAPQGMVQVYFLGDLLVPNPCLRSGPKPVRKVGPGVPR